MGRGIAILLDTLNPELVVVGTLGVVLGESLLRSARETVAAEALPATVAACEIVPAGLGRSVGDVASLMAAITRHPQPPPIQG
jgi:glucokinase